MPTKNNPGLAVELPMEREVTIIRIFDAPRDLVFEAWTNPGTWPNGSDPNLGPTPYASST